MRVLLSPDKFKGSATAQEVVDALSSGVREVYPDASIVDFPIADGGEGFALTASKYITGKWIECPTIDALHREITASYFLFEKDDENKIVYMDMSSASGYELISATDRAPMPQSS